MTYLEDLLRNDVPNAYGTQAKFFVQVTGTRISYQKLGSISACSILSKFLIPDKSDTRMHDRWAKYLVRDSGTSNLDAELGSCAIGIMPIKLKPSLDNCTVLSLITNAFHIPNNIIVHFVPAHMTSSIDEISK